MDDLPPILSRPLIPPVIADYHAGGPAAPPARSAFAGPRLSAGPATIILLVFLSVQFAAVLVVSAVAGFILGVMHAARHATTPVSQDFAPFLPAILAWGMIFGTLGGGIAVAKVSAAMFREHLGDASPLGAAWFYGRLRDCAQGLGAGILVGLGFLLLATLCASLGIKPDPGLLDKVAVLPGLPQVAFIAIALFLAPPVEELLFRGILYGGYRRSFGPARAAALTTGIFVVLHVSEIIRFSPVIFGIGGMALAALWFRLRTAAIGPAVAVHFGYNLVIVAALIISFWAK